MRYIWAVLATINLVFLGWVVWQLPAPQGQPKLTYDQFISISLTAMTVVLAVVALLMAYLAFEGKNQIIEKARQMAVQEVQGIKPELIALLRQDASSQLANLVQDEGNRIYEDLAVTKHPAHTGFDVAQLPDDLKEVRDE